MNRWLKMGLISASITTIFMGDNAGCGEQNVGEQRERQQTEQMNAQISSQVGMPGITRYTEKRQLKMLYELRDDSKLATVTYYIDMQGKKHKICNSFGYGIPYATQYSSPQKDAYYTSSSTAHIALPQSEPNGLYPPAEAHGTWIMCLDPTGKTKDVKPLYIEPDVLVSPWELPTD